MALTFLEMGQQIRATPGQPGAVLPGLFGKRARYEAGGHQGQADRDRKALLAQESSGHIGLSVQAGGIDVHGLGTA